MKDQTVVKETDSKPSGFPTVQKTTFAEMDVRTSENGQENPLRIYFYFRE